MQKRLKCAEVAAVVGLFPLPGDWWCGVGQDLSLKVLLAVNDSQASKVKGFGSVLGDLANPAGLVAKAFGAISLAAVAFGVASVQMAGDYDQAMRMVQSLTGANAQQMAYYDTQVKQLAVDAGVAPTELAKGLYNVLSASYTGADAMKVLTLATEDAKIGMTNATVTTDALTNVLRSFGTQSKDITMVNGEMLQTVTLGKATFEQYAQSIVKSASSAVQFHVSMETMNAAWATMTSSGIRAAQASTDFQQSLKVMDGNIGTVTKSLHKSGIAFDETKFNAMDYGHQVVYLNAALEQANQKHVKVTGVTIQAAQAISTISKHIGDYNSNLAALSDKQKMAQKTQDAWAITQGGFNQTMSRVNAAVQVLMISVGQQLLPVLTKIAQAALPIITGFTNWLIKSGALQKGLDLLGGGIKNTVGFVTGLVTGIGNIVTFFKNCQLATLSLLIPLAILGTILVAMGVAAIPGLLVTIGTLITGFIAWAAAAGAAAIATLAATWPLLLIGAAIGLVIGIIILLWTHWSQVTKWVGEKLAWLGNFFQVIFGAVGAIFSAFGTRVHDIVFGIIGWFQALPGTILSYIENLVSGGIKKFEDFFNNIVKGAQSILGKLGDVISGIFKGAINMAILNPINWIIDQIDKIHVNTPFGSVGFTIPHIPLLAAGGIITQGGLVGMNEHGAEVVSLPTGAAVYPHGSVPAGSRAGGYGRYNSSSGGGNHIYHITINAQNANAHEVAIEVQKIMSRNLRRSGVDATMTSGGKSS